MTKIIASVVHSTEQISLPENRAVYRIILSNEIHRCTSSSWSLWRCHPQDGDAHIDFLFLDDLFEYVKYHICAGVMESLRRQIKDEMEN